MLPDEPVLECFELEEADDNRERLLFAMKPRLDRLLLRLAAEGEALAALQLDLELEHAPTLRTQIPGPAAICRRPGARSPACARPSASSR